MRILFSQSHAFRQPRMQPEVWVQAVMQSCQLTSHHITARMSCHITFRHVNVECRPSQCENARFGLSLIRSQYVPTHGWECAVLYFSSCDCKCWVTWRVPCTTPLVGFVNEAAHDSLLNRVGNKSNEATPLLMTRHALHLPPSPFISRPAINTCLSHVCWGPNLFDSMVG